MSSASFDEGGREEEAEEEETEEEEEEAAADTRMISRRSRETIRESRNCETRPSADIVCGR